MVASETLVTCGVLSIPHLLYCYIWFLPKAYIRTCKLFTKTEAVTVFANTAAALKRAHSRILAAFCVATDPQQQNLVPFLQLSSSRRYTSGTRRSRLSLSREGPQQSGLRLWRWEAPARP